MIDDVLHYLALQKHAFDFEPVDLNACISQVLSDVEVLVAQTGAVIEVEQLPEIEAVGPQLTQLFQNLISNAIKFRKPDTAPVIRISGQVYSREALAGLYAGEDWFSALPQQGQWKGELWLQLTLQDNGIGFDPVYAQKIFELFQRLHNHSTYEGTGIGLAICKRIVEQHHGAIRAGGKPNEGATFRILLPVSQQHFMEQKV
jgi:light-regulated signal transduction histidine kinase (bacteriophytochrome)